MTGDMVDRKTMVMANNSDREVANYVRMLMRTDIDHELICAAARDRIMYLSQRIERMKKRAAIELYKDGHTMGGYAAFKEIEQCCEDFGTITGGTSC